MTGFEWGGASPPTGDGVKPPHPLGLRPERAANAKAAGALADASRAADLDPATLVAMLSAEDYADLDADLLTAEELTAYAKSVSGRWASGWVLPDERELAEAERTRRNPLHGLPLLREDRRYIWQRLARAPEQDHHVLLTQYREHWLTAADAEPVDHRKDNTARAAANDWLRRTTER